MTDARGAHDEPKASIGTAAQLRAGLVVLVAVAACSFASIPLLHLGQRAIGFERTAPQLRAWLDSPQRLGRDGITRGQPVGFNASIPPRSRVEWVMKTDGVAIASGFLTSGSGVTMLHRRVQTFSARPNHWITIWIGDLRIPLKVWVER